MMDFFDSCLKILRDVCLESGGGDAFHVTVAARV